MRVWINEKKRKIFVARADEEYISLYYLGKTIGSLSHGYSPWHIHDVKYAKQNELKGTRHMIGTGVSIAHSLS